MKKIKAKIGLKIVSFGIWIYELYPSGFYDDEDRKNLIKLWEYYDEFLKASK